MIFKFEYNSSINCNMMIKPKCLETKTWLSCYRKWLIIYDDDIFNNLKEFDVAGIKTQYNIKLILVIIFNSSISIIHNLKFIINLSKNKITIKRFCFSTFYCSYFYSLFYILYSINSTQKLFYKITSWGIKFIYSLGSIFSIINFLPNFFAVAFFIIYLLCNRNISIKTTCFHILLIYISYIINWILYLKVESGKYIIIISCITWGIHIIKNIIYNNKYILPLFYYIFFTIEKFIFLILNDTIINPNTKTILFLLIVNIVEIIIIFIQGYYGPRFMFGTLCNEKNNIFYKSKEELLREKPNCKVEVCSICLLPFINNNKNDINNIIENKTNSNKLTNEKDDFNTSEEISENKNKIQIIVYDNKILKQKNKSIWNKNKCNFKKLKKIIKNIFKKYFWDYYYHETKY